MVRLICANRLKESAIQVLENIKNDPKMDLHEMHIVSAMKMLCEMIDDAPTVNMWISPKDFMPDKDEEIFYKYNGDVATDITDFENGELMLYHKYIPVSKVKAWAPLIEPYEGKEE